MYARCIQVYCNRFTPAVFRYIVTGGEDDLVTVWSLSHQRVIARGEGHKSWVTMVSFDPYMYTTPGEEKSQESDR